MRERILIAPNSTELLRTLARNGISTLGLRVMQPAELAQTALMRAGIPLSARIIAADEAAALICRLLPDIPYFNSVSYHDAQNIALALRVLRLQIIENERETIEKGLQSSAFTKKNAALLAVYDRYMNTLRQSKLIDTVGLLRFSLAHAEPLSAEILTMAEFPPAMLENALIGKLSNGTVKTVSMCDLLCISDKPFTMPQITEAYGTVNEAEAVIGSIYAEKIPLDQCLIAVTDPTAYAPLLFEITSRFGIPVTFGCGLPVTLSQPAAVLRDYRRWLTGGHCGIDALRALLDSQSFETEKFCEDFGISDRRHFDRFTETAGSLRLGNDVDENRLRISAYEASAKRSETLVTQLKGVFAEFGMDCAELISRYALIRKSDLGGLDSAAQKKICDTLRRLAALTGEPPEEMLSDLLNTRICIENSREGALHITGISGAVTSLRQNLFVMGLSADRFPGSPTENYLLLDDELVNFGTEAPTSLHRVRQSQRMLDDLLVTANALDVRTELSYCGYDAAELKANNASSVLFTLYQKAGGSDADEYAKLIRHTGYYSQDMSAVTEIGRAYLRGEKTAAHLPECVKTTHVAGPLCDLSTVGIERFIECPKKFCFERVMQIDMPETDNVFEVISPMEFGNLVHEAMEFLCRKRPDEDAFMANADQIFVRFLTERPPMNCVDADKMRADFRSTVRNGFYRAADVRMTAAEQKIEMRYDCGITIHGRPDALAELPDGSFRVIDYKTGRRAKHQEGDAVSCIQVMLYADMLHRLGKSVSAGEYWYLRLDKVVSCQFSPERAALIETKLAEAADAIRTNTYPANASKNNCQYCPYREVCEEGGAVKC